MLDQHPAVRATQPVADMIQERTGATCYRQCWILTAVGIAFVAASVMWTLSGGTPPARTTEAMAICVGLSEPVCRRMTNADRRGAADMGANVAAVMYIMATFMFVGASVDWVCDVATSARGDLPLDFVAGWLIGQARMIAYMRRNDAEFLRAWERGQMVAQPKLNNDNVWLALEAIACAVLVANAIAHGFDAAATLGALAAPAILAANLIGRCRPRPPGTTRRKAAAPPGWGMRRGI